MVGKNAILRRGVFGALCLPVAPLAAQEAGGVQIDARIEQGIEAGSNLALEIPDEGDSVAATTGLSFGISSETRIQRLSFEASGLYRYENLDGENDAGFDSSAMGLEYIRYGANGSLTVSADYTREEIDTLRSIEDFVTPGGTVELPDDFADLSGEGQRTAYEAEATLILGRDAPLGFQFDLGTSGVVYSDTADDGLTDVRRARAGASLRAQLSPVLTGTLGAGYENVDEDDETRTERDIRNVDAGLEYLVSPRATLDARLGYVWNRTGETTGVTHLDGATGRLGLGYDMPNGVLGATLDASRTEDGDSILSFRLRRSLDLPAGPLAASIGVARPENDDAALIGSLDWTRALPTGSLSARFDRGVTVDTDDDIRVTTLIGATYRYDINDLSSLTFDLSHAVTDADAGDRVEESGLTATYTRTLTREWDFTAAAGYRQRDETGTGQADSVVVSATIGRSFSLRR